MLADNQQQFKLYDHELYSVICNVTAVHAKKRISHTLINDHLSRFEFTNDIVTPYLTFKVQYIDRGNYIFSNINADGLTVFNMSLLKNIEDDESILSDSKKLVHSFLLIEKRILDISNDNTTYEFSLISVDWYKYSNNFIYSSNGFKKTIDVLIEVFNKSKLSLDTTGVNTIDYNTFIITPTDYSLLDTINLIASEAIDTTNGPYFISFNHNTDKYQLYNLKQQWANVDPGQTSSYNVFTFPSKNYSPARSGAEYYTISSFEEAGYSTADTNIRKMIPYKFKTFDHLTRNWKDVNISDTDLKKSVPAPQKWDRFVKQFGSLNNSAYIDNSVLNYKREQPQLTEDSYYYDVVDTSLYTNVVIFRTPGNLERRAGQFGFIVTDIDDALYSQYVGLWYIIRVEHVFDDSQYYSVIHASRLDRLHEQTYLEAVLDELGFGGNT